MKSENLIDNEECVITGNIVNRNEEMLLNDTTKEKTRIELNREYCQQYYKKNENKTKERRRMKFIEQVNKKLEKLKLKDPNPPSRKCPSCGLTLYHTTIVGRDRAVKSNRMCNSCKFYGTRNPSFRKTPHNKGVFKRTEEERKQMARNRQLKRNFGIDVTEYDKHFNIQEGKCKICGIHQSKLKKTLYVDHDHTTGEVRGLLCQKCNSGLGMFNENTECLESALKYLKIK